MKTCVTAATIALFLWQASEAVYKFESRLTSLQVEVTLFTAVVSVSECDQNTGSLKIMVGQRLHLRAIKRHQIKF